MLIVSAQRQLIEEDPAGYGVAIVVEPWPDAKPVDFMTQLRSSSLATHGILVRIEPISESRVRIVLRDVVSAKASLRASGQQLRLAYLLGEVNL